METSCTDRATWKQRRAWSRPVIHHVWSAVRGVRRHRHACTFPALNQFPGSAVTVRGERPARYRLAIYRGCAWIGRLHRSARTPQSRRPSWFSKNMGCQGDAEPQAGRQSRAEQGGLNNIVGFQFCEMIITAFSRPPGAWYNTLHNLLYGWSKSI